MNYLPYWVMFFFFFLLNIYCVIDVFRHDFKYPPFATLYLFLLVCVAFRLLASLAYFHPLLCQNWHCWPWIWPSVSVWELKFLSVHSWMLRCVCLCVCILVCVYEPGYPWWVSSLALGATFLSFSTHHLCSLFFMSLTFSIHPKQQTVYCHR